MANYKTEIELQDSLIQAAAKLVESSTDKLLSDLTEALPTQDEITITTAFGKFTFYPSVDTIADYQGRARVSIRGYLADNATVTINGVVYERVKIESQRGDHYYIKCDRPLTDKASETLRDALKPVVQEAWNSLAPHFARAVRRETILRIKSKVSNLRHEAFVCTNQLQEIQ